jgi:plasmid stability protein
MSTLTVRNIEPVIKDKLRLMAAAHGHSMEEEVRSILRQAMTQAAKPSGLGSRIHARFAALGDVVLPLSARSEPPCFATFEEGRGA